ncbi:hypothetical protein [Sphaerisporangium fuscum]|uniref:hypothetical protein n=1 Tax=Sphaerisporangium fuscum TaxID=2835868 RepID=UPI001BDC7778|nr:hypothetical protein [Sphaerisporangium fuscum]
MTDDRFLLEDDLREALRARAATYETSPHAWLAVQRRTNKARRRRWTTLAAAPLVAAAALTAVPMVLSGMRAGPDAGVRTSPTAQASPGHGDAFKSLINEYPPTGEVLAIVDPATRRPMMLWFSRSAYQPALDKPVPKDAPKYDVLCSALEEPDNGGSVGGCPMDRDPSHARDQAWYVGGSDDDRPLTNNRFIYGVARSPVIMVRGREKGGSPIPGMIYRPKGAPAAVWVVPYMAQEKIASVEFVDSDAKTVQRVKPPAEPGLAKGVKAVKPDMDLPGGLTARLHTDGTLVWRHDGTEVGRSEVEGPVTKDVLARQVSGDSPYAMRIRDDFWIGLATARTARVRLTFLDGQSAEARTSLDPWTHSVGMFSAPLPRHGDIYAKGYLVTGYDADGKEIWRHQEPPHPPLWPDVPISTPAR